MKLLSKIRRVLNYKLDSGKDGRPAAYNGFLVWENCSRLLSDFTDHNLSDCSHLILISQDREGGVSVQTSQSCDSIRAIGLVNVALKMLMEGDGED